MHPIHADPTDERTRRAHAAMRKGALIGCVLGTLAHAGIGTGIGAALGAAIGFYCSYRR